jgi:hypothetical protein
VLWQQTQSALSKTFVLPHNQRLHQLLLLPFKSDNSDGDSKCFSGPATPIQKSALLSTCITSCIYFPHLVALFVELSLQRFILEQKIFVFHSITTQTITLLIPK